MLEKEIIITHKAGIHARPAVMLVQAANQYESEIFIRKETEQVDLKSIMGVMMLAITYQTKIIISADGNDEEEAIEHLCNIINNDFQDDS